LGIDQVVRAGGVDALSLPEDLLLDLLSDVEVVILPPFLFLLVEQIAVVVSAVCAAFVNQQGVKMVRGAVNFLVGLFDLSLYAFDLFLVLLDPLPDAFSVFRQQLRELWLNFFAELREVGGVVDLLLCIHLPVLPLQELLGLSEDFEQIELLLAVLVYHLKGVEVLLLLSP
jgi:hypothetical protein